MSQCRIVCCNHAYFMPATGAMRCHFCKRVLSCDGSATAIALPDPPPTGPALWAAMHLYRWESYLLFQDWFDEWLKSVPKLPYCSCGVKFRDKILPRFANRFCKIKSDEEWFCLTVEIHNAVNLEISKPQFSLADAFEKWWKQRTSNN